MIVYRQVKIRKADAKSSDSYSAKTPPLPRSLNAPADRILHLQRAIGNRAIRRLLASDSLRTEGAPARRKMESDRLDAIHGSVHPIAVHKATEILIQRKPGYLVTHNFMGRTVEVNPEMSTRLQDVEAHLQTQYTALPSATRPASLQDYAELQSIRGWRSGSSTSKHASGSAVDVNYQNQPYIPTRSVVGTTTHYGGEESSATAATRALRQPAVEVYDRAASFVRTNPFVNSTADVGQRGGSEATTDVYSRFRSASDALAAYLSLGIRVDFDAVHRVPIADPEGASEADLLSAIPLTERKDETTAVADIQAFMDYFFWELMHFAYPLSAREQYIRILRDYEIVRKPMQRGNPSVAPGDTRNPALGFLHMPEHFVVAMADVGHMRWGACDFGSVASGDVHHFDLGGHAGYTPDGTP